MPKSATGGTDGNRTAQTGYLPYEVDRMLAVILSKAMLLAKDTEITDPTIPASCDHEVTTSLRGPLSCNMTDSPYSAAQAINTQESVP
ncbi:DUF7737 domain-containing protein [Streptomyces neyagawaensis]|uniref:DUF7737 domain-containing protein n=1 Tax=Streptomyces neyagawaensis TaxID=42238 RepID=UPI003F4CC293